MGMISLKPSWVALTVEGVRGYIYMHVSELRYRIDLVRKDNVKD